MLTFQRIKRLLIVLLRINKIYCKKNNKYFIIIVLSLVLSLISMYFLIYAMNKSLNNFGDIFTLERTYTFEFIQKSDIETLHQVLMEHQLYPVATKNFFAYKYNGTTNIDKIVLIFPEKLSEFNNKNLLYQIRNGRYFTKKEIEERENVVILNYLEYMRDFPNVFIGDSFSYEGINLTLIGISNDVTLIPFATFLDNNLLQNKIHINYIELKFQIKLDRNILHKISDEYEKRATNKIIIQSLFNQVIDSIIPYIVLYLLFIGLINILFLISVRQLFSLIDHSQNRYKIVNLTKLGMNLIYWRICRIYYIEKCLFVSYIISIFAFYVIYLLLALTNISFMMVIKYTLFIFILVQIYLIPTFCFMKIYNKIDRRAIN